tara:strand:+ start:230 stop:376 length:147 start_codon:yes stop_codon:yes gene_type:complete
MFANERADLVYGEYEIRSIRRYSTSTFKINLKDRDVFAETAEKYLATF